MTRSEHRAGSELAAQVESRVGDATRADRGAPAAAAEIGAEARRAAGSGTRPNPPDRHLHGPQAHTKTWDTPLALGLLIVLGSALMFINYGSGEFYRWDEGLYGQFARNALTHQSFLVPLDTAGHYAEEPFSKPPLSFALVAFSFALLSPTIFALRLPFTLASLLLSVVCFFWGSRLLPCPRRSAWFGFGWGLGLLMTTASLRWGRYAAIEPLFVLFLIGALFLHSLALGERNPAHPRPRRAHAYALAAGVSLMLAFLTKQLACGLALLPMVVVELTRLRHEPFKRPSASLGLLIAPSLLAGGAWAFAAYQQAGPALANMLLDFALRKRFAGFTGTTHFNFLNRVSRNLDEVAAPFSWQLGMAGLALFVLTAYVAKHAQARHRQEPLSSPIDSAHPPSIVAPSAALLGLFLLTCTLVMENLSKSTLPWYVYSFMPVVCFGNVWLVVGACELLFDGFERIFRSTPTAPQRMPSPLAIARASSGLLAMLLILDGSFDRVGSRLNGIVIALSGGFALWVWLRRQRRFEPRRAWLLVPLAGYLLLILASRFRHDEFRQETSSMSQLMNAVARFGAERVAIDQRITAHDVKHYEIVTLFGTHATLTAPPWKDGNGRNFDAYVQLFPEPSELEPRAGVQMARAPGAVAWFGDLSSAPYGATRLEEQLGQGPLTYEAEYQVSERRVALHSDADASGGRARGHRHWLSSDVGQHAVTQGRIGRFSEGDYVAVFYVKYRCGPYRGSRIGSVGIQAPSVDKKRELPCDGRDHDERYEPVVVSFELDESSWLEPRVTFRRGRGELWHDKTEIWRKSVFNAQRSHND